jgi:hypothetical protein
MEDEETLILNTADRKILRTLYASLKPPLALFQLHKDLGFSPAQVGSFVAKFVKNGIVNLQDESISLTEYGRKWLIANRIKVFLSHVHYDWQDIPREMRKQKNDVTSLYSPKKCNLGEHFFEDTLI